MRHLIDPLDFTLEDTICTHDKRTKAGAYIYQRIDVKNPPLL